MEIERLLGLVAWIVVATPLWIHRVVQIFHVSGTRMRLRSEGRIVSHRPKSTGKGAISGKRIS